MPVFRRLLAALAPSPRPSALDDRPGEHVKGPDGRYQSWYVKASEMPRDRYVTALGVMPPLHLVSYDGHLILCEDETGLLIGPANRAVKHAGIIVANLRGENYHQPECRAGEFSPGVAVRLAREPDNPHDPNAVAVHARDHDGVAGYLDRTRAKAVAKVLDTGQPVTARSLHGAGAGKACDQIAVVIADPDVLAHLFSPRPQSLPSPAHLRH